MQVVYVTVLGSYNNVSLPNQTHSDTQIYKTHDDLYIKQNGIF